MLSGKRWRPDAVVRLFTGVFICMYMGSVISSLLLGRMKEGINPFLAFAALTVAIGFLGTTLVLLGSAWKPEGLRSKLAVLLICFYAGLFGGAWVQSLVISRGPSVWQMVMAALSFQGAGLLLVWRFLREHETGFAEAFGTGQNWPKALLVGCVSALLFLPAGWGLQQISALVMTNLPFFSLEPQEQQAVQTLRTAGSYLDRIALGVVTIVIAPPAEEVLFRGVLYRWIKDLGYPQVAVWGTSLLFAVVHLNMLTFLPLLVLAMLLVWLYESTGNLLAPIAAHMVFNAMNFALFYLVT